MATLVVTAHADREFGDVQGYLDEVAGPATAGAYAQRFADTLELIAQSPSAGPRRPALGVNTRIMIVLPYVLIYDYDDVDDHVVLPRVLHGRRRITERLLDH